MGGRKVMVNAEEKTVAAERIDERIDGPARELLGFALEEQLNEFDQTLQRIIDAETFIPVMTLIARVASIAVVRRCGDASPVDDDFDRISGEIVDAYAGTFPLQRSDVHAYLARVLFGGEPVDAVLASEKSVVVPVLIAVTLLGTAPEFSTWHEYLDALEAGLEETGSTSHLTADDIKRT